MRALRVAPAVALALAAVLALAPAAAGMTADPLLGGPLFGQSQALLFRWSGTATPPGTMRTAITAAAVDANATRASKAPTFTYDAKGPNVIAYGGSVPCGVNGLACFSRWAPDGFGMWLRENGHRFDWGTLRWCEMSGDPDGCFEAETITLDELGHVMGLDHHVNLDDDSDYTDAVVQAVSRAKPKAGWNAHELGRCDVAALQQAYDLQSSFTPVSTCLDLPALLDVTLSRTSLVPGGAVTASATLRLDGPGRLAQDFLSGRVVVLQRATAAGWVDLATMAPGVAAGTYAASVTLWATTDLRAVFRKPAGEGVRAAVTDPVTVTAVGSCTGGGCVLGGGGGAQ